MFIYWFDIEIRKIVREHVSSNNILNNGLKFDVIKIVAPDIFFAWYMEKRGYSTIKLTESVLNKLPLMDALSRFNFKERDVDDLLEKGIPDFLVYNEKEFFFVELKVGLDGIRFHQMRWAFVHKYPFRYCWIVLNQYEILGENKLFPSNIVIFEMDGPTLILKLDNP